MRERSGCEVWRCGAGVLALGLTLALASCSAPPCCRGDGDCAPGHACVGGQCRPRCSFEGQCALGQRCDVERGACVGGPQRQECLLDDAGASDRAAGDVRGDAGGVEAGADGGRRDAVGLDLPTPDAPPRDGASAELAHQDRPAHDQGPSDLQDWDKPPEAGSGDGAAACVDDIFEDNDDRQHAASISSAPLDAVLCPGDPDFYIVDRGMNATVTATVRCTLAPGPLTMILRLPGGARLVRTCSPAVGEAVASLSVPEPGPATIELSTVADVAAPYNLQVTVDGVQPPCGADPFEPNNSASAAFIVRHGSSLNAAVCADDEDYFGVVMTSGTTLAVSQELGSPCAGDRLALLAPNGTTVLAEDSATSGARSVSASVTQSGTYYVHVRSGCVDSSYYALRVGDSSCADDALEDNDSLGQATAVLPSTIAAAICPGDDDYYGFSVVQGTPLRLDLRFSHATGDLDLALLDPVARRVGLSQGVGDVEVVQATASRSGIYTARVYGFNGAQGPYNLDICLDDPWEENDAPDRAVALPATSLRGVLCRGDLDHYALELFVPSIVRVTLSPQQGLALSRLQLVRSRDAAVVASGVAGSSDLTLEYMPTESGRHVLVLEGPPQSTLYDLQVVVQQD